MVLITNPFLKELLETFLTVGGRKGKIDFDELGVREVVQLLRDADMEAVLRDFGDRNPQDDPVIHFYELFLKEYDARKRIERGVFYTPRPVVSYIVRSVDDILRNEFGLEDGLADTAAWGAVLTRNKTLSPPKGVPLDSPFVQILDPATGTGTFLVEVIDVIHRTMEAKWKKKGYMPLEFERLWNEYVPKYLLPRLHGFELMMAPYAIAHMKIGLKLAATGYRFRSDERARVYLTNSLEPPTDDKKQREFEEWAPALAHEALAVDAVKRRNRFTVVVGNPPYAGVSVNHGEWITNLIDVYRSVDGVPLDEKKVWLKNDYVKFIRLCQFDIQNSESGIVGLITDHSYLDSPTFRGLRKSLPQGSPKTGQ
jgi:predicted helicase